MRQTASVAMIAARPAMTAHTGSDMVPVKAHSTARSSMTTYPVAGSMAQGDSSGHPRPALRSATSAGKFELAFPGHALERLVGALDAVLIVGPVRRKQPHDLIGAIGGHMADRTRGEVDDLTDLKLVFFQRDSPTLERRRTHPFWGQ